MNFVSKFPSNNHHIQKYKFIFYDEFFGKRTLLHNRKWVIYFAGKSAQQNNFTQ